MQEMQVQSWVWKIHEEKMATHSVLLCGGFNGQEEPGGLPQSHRITRVGHDSTKQQNLLSSGNMGLLLLVISLAL